MHDSVQTGFCNDTLYKINAEILKTYIFQLSLPSISEEQKQKFEQLEYFILLSARFSADYSFSL